MDRGRRRDVAVAVGILAAGAVVAALVGAGGWPGAPSGCVEAGDCYCELRHGGLVAQPVNTFSNLGFVAVGLGVLAFAGAGAGRRNRFTTDAAYRRTYGAVVISLGVASMVFHGTMTEWGGWADLVSMHLFVTFVLLYDLAVTWRRRTRWFLGSWTAANLVLGIALWLMDNGYGKYLFAALLVATVVVDLRVTRPPEAAVARDRRLLGAGLGVYLGGQVVWLLSRDGAPWCAPASLFQGHALWHLTGAATVALVYLYLSSEREHAPALEPAA
jgi:hypothetical protein